MILIQDAIDAINRVRDDAIVVGTMTPNRYWASVSDNPDLDLPIFGAMGKASSVALGLALARPDKKVLVLDGDGGLLMNLGSLVTIAGMAPENLVHFCFEDGVYQTTGAQPVPGAGVFDLKGIARGAGIVESHTFDNLEDFVSELPVVLDKRGPVFVNLKIEHPPEGVQFYMGSTKDAIWRLKDELSEG